MSEPSLRARFKETVSEAILDAAEQLAAEVGLPAASLQAIAQRAGVAVGTIYNHFADRNELFTEIFARRRQELLTTLDAQAKSATGAPFDVQLDGFVRTVFTFFDARRPFLTLALDGSTAKAQAKGQASGGRTSVEQLHLRAERIVRLGLKEKRLRADGGDLFALFLVAAVRGVLIAKVHDPKPIAGETDRVIALFLKGAER
jgi:AcrR family transcriptional regulator